MYYKLQKNIGLCGWKNTPYAARHFLSGNVEPLHEAFFQALSYCDGRLDCDSIVIPPAYRKLIRLAAEKGAVVPCEKGDRLDTRQNFKMYPCNFISTAHWSITGNCNMRCRHCYLSAPQAKFGEVSTETALMIVEQLVKAGIGKINLTGGEPLVRSDFWEIVSALQKNDIVISQIYTNGLLVTETFLDEMERRSIKPEFSLSFDGLGWHDWMRGVEGAEKAAIDAIRLLKKRGYSVSIESAFHRDSIGSLKETMALLVNLEVDAWKINPVSNSGNWLNESRSLDLSANEMYDAYLSLIGEYLRLGSPINICMAGFFTCHKGSREYSIPCKKLFNKEQDRLLEPLCSCARYMMYIAADARLLPCMPLSGIAVKDDYPTLHEVELTQALQNSVYFKRISASVQELLDHNQECAACEHRLHCNGGCRAAALMENDCTDYLGTDRWICRFFKDGYEEKIRFVVANNAVEAKNLA